MDRSKEEVIRAILANLEMAYRTSFDRAAKMEAQERGIESALALGKASGFLECIALVLSESQQQQITIGVNHALS